MKSNHETCPGCVIFRATMNMQLLLFIIMSLRFDDAAARDHRKAEDSIFVNSDISET